MKFIGYSKIKTFIILVLVTFTFITFAIKIKDIEKNTNQNLSTNSDNPPFFSSKKIPCVVPLPIVPLPKTFLTSAASVHRDISFRDRDLFKTLNSNA
jgi:hypothetical protein